MHDMVAKLWFACQKTVQLSAFRSHLSHVGHCVLRAVTCALSPMKKWVKGYDLVGLDENYKYCKLNYCFLVSSIDFMELFYRDNIIILSFLSYTEKGKINLIVFFISYLAHYLKQCSLLNLIQKGINKYFAEKKGCLHGTKINIYYL